MKNNDKKFAIKVLTNNINSLLNEFSNVEEDSQQSVELQEKVETLEKVKDQIYLGNKNLIQKVIEKKHMGIL